MLILVPKFGQSLNGSRSLEHWSASDFYEDTLGTGVKSSNHLLALPWGLV